MRPRCPDWLVPMGATAARAALKMKLEASQELVVGGFTDPEGKRVGLGALLVGYDEADHFVFAGLPRLRVHWVEPQIVVQVRARAGWAAAPGVGTWRPEAP